MLCKTMAVIRREENTAKIIVGICLAICSIFVQQRWFRGNILMAVVMSCFAVCFVAIGFLRIETRTQKGCVALNLLWGLLFLFGSIFTSIPISFSADGLKLIALNYLCAMIVLICVYVITAQWKWSVVIATFLVVFLITVNTFVFQFRAVEVSITDILSIKTALSVADQYQIVVTKRITGLLAVYALLAFSKFSLPTVPWSCSPWKRRGVAVLLLIAAVQLLQIGSANIQLRTWRDEGTIINGYLLNFYIGIRELQVEVPEQYSLEFMEELSGMYSESAEIANVEDLPNIIVIMDEAFADFNCFENELDTNVSVTPFIDSLSDNVIKGYALSSVFGGNTANSEFEFLTGHNMMFLPNNTVPYQQYIKQDVYSLVWLLRDYGYTCNSTHPYAASGWCRDIVYPYLGFENSYFLEDYPQEQMLRYYVSDEEVFDGVVDAIEEESGPLFTFAITMQNHGDYYYTGDDFVKEIELQGDQQGYPEAEQYLNLLHATDKAVESLLTSLENSSEDTIVLFFGDHYPKIEHAFYETLNGGSFDGLDVQQEQYKVPFFIWANYEISSEFVECTSLSYLGCYLLECAGMPLSPYYQFLSDAEVVIPALNAKGYFSKQENCFVTFENAGGEEQVMLEALQNVQYNNLFDHENRNERFFQSYISE